jgi:hypothetical protein
MKISIPFIKERRWKNPNALSIIHLFFIVAEHERKEQAHSACPYE